MSDDGDVSSFTAGDVARITGGFVLGAEAVRLAGVAPLESARSGDLSFLASRRFLPMFHDSNAGAVLIAAEFEREDNGRSTRIVVGDPYRAINLVIGQLQRSKTVQWGIDASASIGVRSKWSGRIAISRNAIIGSDVQFGSNCAVGVGSVIGNRVTVGNRVTIASHVTIEDGVQLGDDVMIHSGARVGTEGFSYRSEVDAHDRMHHIGGCVLHDGVDVGANTTIDRGTLGNTVIGAQTKIDNLVHVAHNCRVGKRCLIMAQVGMAGSTIVEDDVMLAGQAGLAGHLTVGTGARVAAQAGVIGDIAPSATVSGYPARDHREVLRQAAAVRRLASHVKTLERVADSART